jgi:hypothetical protein
MVVGGGLVAVVLAVALTAWLSSGGTGDRVKAGRQLASGVTTSAVATPTTTIIGPVASSGATLAPDTTAAGATSQGAAVADSGGRTVVGSPSPGTGSQSAPTGHTSPSTAAPRPGSPPPAAAASACPGRAVAQVTRFGVAQFDEASGLYYVDVGGTVCNGTSTPIDLYSADLAYFDGSGARVDTGSVDLNGTLAPGQTQGWSLHHESVNSPDSPPTRAAVTKFRYA